MGIEAPTEALPLELTIQAMDEGNVDIGLAAAWYGPAGDLINNDEVAARVAKSPRAIAGFSDLGLDDEVARVWGQRFQT